LEVLGGVHIIVRGECLNPKTDGGTEGGGHHFGSGPGNVLEKGRLGLRKTREAIASIFSGDENGVHVGQRGESFENLGRT